MANKIFTKEDYFKILDGAPKLLKLPAFAQRLKGIAIRKPKKE